MRTLLISILIVTAGLLQAQSTLDVKAHKISKRVVTEISHEDGLKQEVIVEEKSFDEQGHLVEFKDWTKDGKLKEWRQYTYNAEGLLQSETLLSGKGKQEEKEVYEYTNGLRVKKSYYDHKDRLVKEKIYDYSNY